MNPKSITYNPNPKNHPNLVEKFLQNFSNITRGTLTLTLPNGKIITLGGKATGLNASLQIHDLRFFPLVLTQNDIGFTKSYMRGYVDTPDLITFGRLMVQNMASPHRYRFLHQFSNLGQKIKYLFQQNTLKGSKKNIPAHYDLGNSFYQLWLDKNMNYSSALFKNTKEDLVLGQINKNTRLLDQLEIKSGSLLEIGCGWGAFAELATTRGDYDFHGISLSQAQLAYAQKRLKGKAHMEYRDYRHVNRQYDGAVSIEMFEAVGKKFWDNYFNKLYQCLKPKAKAAVATIYIDDKFYDNYVRTTDMIRTFIFPGGFLPCPTVFFDVAKNQGLKIADVFHYGQSYAKTLKIWLERFDQQYKAIKKSGYQDEFIRLWRCYLAFCSAAFAEDRIGVMQVTLSK